MLTEAEQLFEKLCTERGISFRRIETREVRTPDYELSLSSGTVLVEVKQLEPNADDIAYAEELRTAGHAHRMVDMGRAGPAIKDAVNQLRPHAKGRLPAIVVLYDTMGMTNYLDPYSLSVALYGPEKIHYAVPKDLRIQPWVLSMNRGGGAVATPKHNTTLSAVAVLYARADGSAPDLMIYHNFNASLPLPLGALRPHGFRQFEFDAPTPGSMPTWIDRTPELIDPMA